MRIGVDKQSHDVLGSAAEGNAHGLSGSSRLVQKRRARNRQTGEILDEGLEVQKSLKSPLGDLRLIGRVRGVPSGTLEHIALDDTRNDRVGVAESDHRGEHTVTRRDVAHLCCHLRLGATCRNLERLTPVDDARNNRVGQFIETAVPNGGEHASNCLLIRTDVAVDEGAAGCRWHC